MTHIPRLFCGCGREMRNEQTGVRLEVFANMGAYYKIDTDRYECDRCAATVFVPAGAVYASHFEPDYGDIPTDVRAELRD